jgi:hypothetical protein
VSGQSVLRWTQMVRLWPKDVRSDAPAGATSVGLVVVVGCFGESCSLLVVRGGMGGSCTGHTQRVTRFPQSQFNVVG